MTKDAINVKLRPFGLYIQNNRDGYSYFIDRDGNQIGASVMVCYLNQATREEWVEYALQAWGQHESRSLPFDAVTCVKTLRATGNATDARRILQTAAQYGLCPLTLWNISQSLKEKQTS